MEQGEGGSLDDCRNYLSETQRFFRVCSVRHCRWYGVENLLDGYADILCGRPVLSMKSLERKSLRLREMHKGTRLTYVKVTGGLS